ncbi:hypothetical protein Tco_0412305 [Tanacetum coccineum]
MFMANLSSTDPVYDEAMQLYNNVSSVTNDAYMMIYNDMCEPHAQSVSKTTRNIVVDNSLTAELETYKEQVELYERRARFELTEREQKIDEQLRIVITDRNIKEENLKKELHSVKLQLASTINHNKSMVEEVTKALKEQTSALRPTKCMTVYPPSTPANTCPRVLPTRVKERVLKQPRLLSHEVNLHFSKTLKEHFEGIQKALTKEVKEMKEIFKELEAEVDPKHVVDRKHDEIERKNLLIANDNLIADCLFKDVFHVATNLSLMYLSSLKCMMPTPVLKHVVLELGRVNSCSDASRSQPKSNTKKNMILPAKSVNQKKVEEHPKTNKSSLKTTNHINSSISYRRIVTNSNSHSVCKTCNKCLIFVNHDMRVVNYLHFVNASPYAKNVMRKVQQVWKPKQLKQVWKPTCKILTNVGYQWMPMGRSFTLRAQCPLTRLTKSKVVAVKQTESISTSKNMITRKLSHTFQKPLTRYQCNNQPYQAVPGSISTPPENKAIAYAKQLDPNQN